MARRKTNFTSIPRQFPRGEPPIAGTPAPEATPTLAFRLARWVLRRIRRGYGRPFERVPSRVWGGPALTVATEVGPMLIPVADRGVRAMLIFGRLSHEVSETRLLAQIFRRTHRVLDVGANLGWYSALATSVNPRVEAHAFEANPDVLPYLRVNAARRGFIVHEAAVSDHHGETAFYCAPWSGYSSASRRVGRRITVPTIALDELQVGGIDFVKVDVEGGEVAVLRGARRLRASSPHAIWMIEADHDMLREAGSSLEELEDEMDLAPSTRLFTVDAAGRWHQIRRILEMRSNLHKNVLVVPAEAQVAGLFEGAC